MRNLRLLKISNIRFSNELEYLSDELRYLKWHGYPLKSLPSNFQPKHLFKLDMCYSNIQYLWKGIKHFEELKTIKLKNSHNLIRTPDFTGLPNLEGLDLEGCTRLLEVHPSIGFLKQLNVLNLKGCKNIVIFPSDVCGLKSLKILNLYGCTKLDKLPHDLEELECLEELDVVESDHLWLAYLSRWMFESGSRDQISTSKHVRAHFRIIGRDKKECSSSVKSCGIRLVYKRNVEYHFEESSGSDSATTIADDQQNHDSCCDLEWMSFTEIHMPDILLRSSIRKPYSRMQQIFDDEQEDNRESNQVHDFNDGNSDADVNNEDSCPAKKRRKTNN
ncbi:hypothetical protein JRO89_XS07G0285200 [Xanthoceras sorbifolium]|uniref:Uncharacterized protein n=1 Tax=Xanthoceras sorbifolium TaxID=99658 RepID=A0ABQ8HVJ0_9ROSI|nr:hypothetical protein JRO89_XS07G0285200 [Xanthoceras sorbifolium]